MREEPYHQTRRMMASAIRRLNVLEYVMLGVAGALALLGGALVAWGLQAAAGFPFRTSWFVFSLLFFVVPGAVVLGKQRRLRARTTEPPEPPARSDENDV